MATPGLHVRATVSVICCVQVLVVVRVRNKSVQAQASTVSLRMRMHALGCTGRAPDSYPLPTSWHFARVTAFPTQQLTEAFCMVFSKGGNDNRRRMHQMIKSKRPKSLGLLGFLRFRWLAKKRRVSRFSFGAQLPSGLSRPVQMTVCPTKEVSVHQTSTGGIYQKHLSLGQVELASIQNFIALDFASSRCVETQRGYGNRIWPLVSSPSSFGRLDAWSDSKDAPTCTNGKPPLRSLIFSNASNSFDDRRYVIALMKA